MGDYHEFTDQYKVPVIAKLLHALPHYNITFHKINSTFRPNDEIYLEVSRTDGVFENPSAFLENHLLT